MPVHGIPVHVVPVLEVCVHGLHHRVVSLLAVARCHLSCSTCVQISFGVIIIDDRELHYIGKPVSNTIHYALAMNTSMTRVCVGKESGVDGQFEYDQRMSLDIESRNVWIRKQETGNGSTLI